MVGLCVLVVDDNMINLQVAQCSLEYYGVAVDIASSGEEAIALCRRKHYQMVFMDQMMPQMDGIEAMKQIRKLEPYYDFGGECKIIVLTANTEKDIREQLIGEGFDEYLGKPINHEKLDYLTARFFPEKNLSREKETAATQTDKAHLTLEELKRMLPQVDVEQGIENCGGKPADYFDVLQIICRDGEKQLTELRELWEQKNYPEYTAKIHTLKGIALNIGAERIAELARTQENAGRQGETGYIDAHMEELEQEYQLLVEKMQMAFSCDRMPEDAVQILKDIRRCLEEFDFARASRLLREAQSGQIPEQYAGVFVQLNQCMEEMETEKMLQLIEEYTGL